MGILEQMGIQNGFTDFLGSNRRAIAGFGSGLASGRNLSQGLAFGTQGLSDGSVQDDAYATAQKAEAERLNQINKTAEFVRSKGYDDLLPLIEAGQGSAALSEAFNRMNAKPAGPDIRVVGGSLVNVSPDGSGATPIYTTPPETPKPTSSIQEYNFAVEQGYPGTFQQYETDMKKAGATNIDLNANQSAAAAYADRMAAANQVLADPKLLTAMTDPTKAPLASVPGVGNYLVGPEYQMAEQAQRDFVNAILRRESGAVISPSEFENAKKQYFPQPGDSPEVIQQKAANRQIAIDGVTRAAGSGYQAPNLSPAGVSQPQVTSNGVQWSVVQ